MALPPSSFSSSSAVAPLGGKGEGGAAAAKKTAAAAAGAEEEELKKTLASLKKPSAYLLGVKTLSSERYKFLKSRYGASTSRRALCVSTMLFYHLFGFWLSRAELPFLDDLTEKYFRGNLLERGTKAFVDHFSSRYSIFQLATIGTILAHQVVYFVLAAPDFLYQFIPVMDRYRIQEKRAPLSVQWEWLKSIAFNHWVFHPAFMFLNFIFVDSIGYGIRWSEFPTWYQVLGTLLGCMAAEDTWHFFSHWLCHKPFLYKNVHKQHHEALSPGGIAAEYAHPAEALLLGVGFAVGCGVYCRHFFVTWLWLLVRELEAVEVHGSYDCPLPLYGFVFHYLPFYAGPRYHNFHHSNFVGNYSSSFTYWDELFDTCLEYYEFEDKRKKQEEKEKGVMMEKPTKTTIFGWFNRQGEMKKKDL